MEYDFLNYYGSDYLAATFAIIGMFYIGDKKRVGFVLYMIATSLGLIFAFLAKSPPLLLTNVIMFGMNLRGFMRWKANPH